MYKNVFTYCRSFARKINKIKEISNKICPPINNTNALRFLFPFQLFFFNIYKKKYTKITKMTNGVNYTKVKKKKKKSLPLETNPGECHG